MSTTSTRKGGTPRRSSGRAGASMLLMSVSTSGIASRCRTITRGRSSSRSAGPRCSWRRSRTAGPGQVSKIERRACSTGPCRSAIRSAIQGMRTSRRSCALRPPAKRSSSPGAARASRTALPARTCTSRPRSSPSRPRCARMHGRRCRNFRTRVRSSPHGCPTIRCRNPLMQPQQVGPMRPPRNICPSVAWRTSILLWLAAIITSPQWTSSPVQIRSTCARA
mmetsp:Transcript_22030/g.41500  ORF Transcript_22030/g.41500 Transcript_22030/m.41500 type:complete len:222 (+) Transcript_22030:241-906(+)